MNNTLNVVIGEQVAKVKNATPQQLAKHYLKRTGGEDNTLTSSLTSWDSFARMCRINSVLPYEEIVPVTRDLLEKVESASKCIESNFPRSYETRLQWLKTYLKQALKECRKPVIILSEW